MCKIENTWCVAASTGYVLLCDITSKRWLELPGPDGCCAADVATIEYEGFSLLFALFVRPQNRTYNRDEVRYNVIRVFLHHVENNEWEWCDLYDPDYFIFRHGYAEKYILMLFRE